VLVAHRRRETGDGPVVVGLDGSAASERALLEATAVAERERRTLVAVRAVAPVFSSNGEVCGPDEQGVQAETRLLAELLAGVRADHPDVDVVQALDQGHLSTCCSRTPGAPVSW